MSRGTKRTKQKELGHKRKISEVEKPKAIERVKVEVEKGNIKALKNRKMQIAKFFFLCSSVKAIAFLSFRNDFLMCDLDPWMAV